MRQRDRRLRRGRVVVQRDRGGTVHGDDERVGRDRDKTKDRAGPETVWLMSVAALKCPEVDGDRRAPGSGHAAGGRPGGTVVPHGLWEVLDGLAGPRSSRRRCSSPGVGSDPPVRSGTARSCTHWLWRPQFRLAPQAPSPATRAPSPPPVPVAQVSNHAFACLPFVPLSGDSEQGPVLSSVMVATRQTVVRAIRPASDYLPLGSTFLFFYYFWRTIRWRGNE